MRRKSVQRTRSRKSGFNYEKLEPRQMLAALFMGTNGNDSADVTYVDETHVNVTINDTLHENVDITDGIRINLAGNSIVVIGDVGMVGDDTISIDHRITGDLGIFNTEVVSVDGGDNYWQIGFHPDPLPEGSVYFDTNFGVPGVTAGRLNGNITVSGFNRITTGDGRDTFDINLDHAYGLSIASGAGDDLFRFNSANISSTIPDDSPQRPALFSSFRQEFIGQDGNDRFVFRGGADVIVRGWAGYDVVDYSRSANSSLQVNAGRVIGDNWSDGNEKVIGAVNHQNSVYASRAKNPVLSWIINGRRAKLIDPASGATMEFENFTHFKGNAIAQDQFWVLRTASDISIENADWIQVSSDLDPLKGNLDSIKHTILVVRGEEAKMFPADSPPVQGPPASPTVIISDATGDGLTANFGANHVFSRNGSAIRFVDNLIQATASSDESNLSLGFQPLVTVHGSQTAADYFTVDNGWDNLKLHSYGGDDAFFVGSPVNGLQRIGSLDIFAGQGKDRLYANNQGPVPADGILVLSYSSFYALSDTSLKVTKLSSNESSYGVSTLVANLRFDRDLDVVRVAGAAAPSVHNRFTVTPSTTTTFAVEGKAPLENSNDLLTFAKSSADPYRVNNGSIAGQGAVSFSGRAKNVYFYDLNVSPYFEV